MQIVDAGPPIEVGALEELEREIGAALPADYRSFLLEYNGGRPKPCTFRAPSHAEGLFDVQELFGIALPFEASNLTWNFWEYRSDLGENLLPIGCTDTNDLVVLILAGPRRGEVMFWDSMARDRTKALYDVADSFREFLGSLSDIE